MTRALVWTSRGVRRRALEPAEAAAAGEDVQEPEAYARVHPDQHVLDRGHRLEEADVLERPAHAEGGDLIGAEADERMVGEPHFARVRGIEAGEDVEQRRLASA